MKKKIACLRWAAFWIFLWRGRLSSGCFCLWCSGGKKGLEGEPPPWFLLFWLYTVENLPVHNLLSEDLTGFIWLEEEWGATGTGGVGRKAKSLNCHPSSEQPQATADGWRSGFVSTLCWEQPLGKETRSPSPFRTPVQIQVIPGFKH